MPEGMTAWLGANATPKGRQMRCDISLLVCRWLLERAQGISILHHRGQLERGMLYNKRLPDAMKRDQQIALTTLPFLSRLLSPEASLHLDVDWGMSALYCLPHILMFE